MNMRKTTKVIFLLALVSFLICLISGPAAAADGSAGKSADKKLSSKHELEALEQDPEAEEADGTTPFQKIVGFGSIVVMIIVVKFL